ncbi:hypothetical protein BegalDRAFT_1239 [Beggiatoa alba B18LD]|uniref:NRDE family protein n=1 Tax=Beggiatoa alba B18LD TaxID=395493 RepID=I3CEU5_9GAMM|nr:NRDE family protein [Beggiatoa alba]EIJ42138.1 hypothetical protein BegalDRAFT_1239 [Beggiatoa alba B18LD]
MCLILLAYQTHPRYPLIIAANRDEFHARPTLAAHFWSDAPNLLAGRDLQNGGTWMGITQQGQFAALTNYREAQQTPSLPSYSRGLLVSDFLRTSQTLTAYITNCLQQADLYKGFNLLLGNLQQLYYLSNRSAGYQLVPAGVHALSNHLLNTPWVKVQAGKNALQTLLNQDFPLTALFDVLADRTPVADAQLPKTGVSLAWERLLSPRFIVSPEYGTRSSTVLRINTVGIVDFCERSFNATGDLEKVVNYQFTVQ